MLTVRRSEERGHADHGWLKALHTFSFGGYLDRNQMGFRVLRVINEDRVLPARGFGKHPHADMEIITYVLEGALAHEDSTGTISQIRPGEVQVMSAGTGIYHSEVNPSKTDKVHLLQIWILPARKGAQPRYDERDFAEALDRGDAVLLVSGDGRDGSLEIGQDVLLYGARPRAGATHEYELGAGRHGWVQVARGEITVNGAHLAAGDAVAISEEETVKVSAAGDSEYLFFDLP